MERQSVGWVYLIVEGTVEFRKMVGNQTVQLETISAGEMFGAENGFGPATFTASAISNGLALYKLKSANIISYQDIYEDVLSQGKNRLNQLAKKVEEITCRETVHPFYQDPQKHQITARRLT